MDFVDVSGFSSYDLNMFGYAVSPGAVGSVVAYQVQLAWYDDLISGVPVFEEDWYAWAGRAAPSAGSNTLAGCGPMHGRYMNVTIFVPIASTAGLVLQYVNIFGSFRTLPYSDWRQNGEAVDPQVNGLVLEAGGGLSFENILCSIQGATITTASRVYFIPLGLYAGPVYYAMSLSIAAGAAPVIAAVGGTVGGQLIAGNGCPGTLYVNGNVANTQYSGQLILPRSACAFIIQVPAGGSETFSLFVAAQQAA
jgi:hypothetical protein